MKQTISVLVENRAGVLNRITGLFSRRAFNIESLAVGVTDDPTISRITIIVDSGNNMVGQVEKQLNKLVEVIKVRTLEENADVIAAYVDPVPGIPTLHRDIFANVFPAPGNQKVLYGVYNCSDKAVEAEILEVPDEAGFHYVELYADREVKAAKVNGKLRLTARLDADTAGKINKCNMNTGFRFQICCQLEQNAGQSRIVGVGKGIGC